MEEVLITLKPEDLGMLFLVYDLITIPFFFAFTNGETDVIVALGLLTTLYWTSDMVMTFFVGYWTRGSLEMHPQKVAMNYLSTLF